MTREMKDSGIEWIGKIPQHWLLERLQWHLYEIKNKNNPIVTKNVLSLTKDRGVIPYEEKGAQGNISKENYSEYHLAYKDTIVANSMNILIGSVGYSNYLGCVSPVYYVFKEKKGNNLRFINYVMQTQQFQKELRKYANGILEIRLRVSSADILKRMAAFPSLNEQNRIVKYLDKKCSEISSIVEDIQKQIEVLEQYKRSTITEAVTKGLNPNAEMKDSRIFYMAPYNKEWHLSKIGYECTKLHRPICETENEALICSNKGKVCIRPKEMSGKMVSEDHAMQGIKKNDIAIHGMDTWHGAIAYSEFNGKITRVVHVCDSKQDKRFIVYYMQHLAFQGVYKLISDGIRGNTSDFRSWEKVKDIYIAFPLRSEQKEIADYLDKKCAEIESIITDKKIQIETIEKYKKSLIYEYVTGKKEVVDE